MEMHMKTAVRYQSRGGNTKAVAEVIAQKVGEKAESVETPLDEWVDVLFVGGGVYMGTIDKALETFLYTLSKEKVGRIVCFSTTGMQDVGVKHIARIAEQNEIQVDEKKLTIRMMLRGHAYLGQKGGTLTQKQIEKTEEFVQKVLFI